MARTKPGQLVQLTGHIEARKIQHSIVREISLKRSHTMSKVEVE